VNILFIIALVCLTLQFVTTAALYVLGSAPRWRRVRWLGAAAFTAGCYSVVDAIEALRASSNVDTSWSLRINLFLGTLHAASWLVYTNVARDGQWRSLPRWVRMTVLGATVLVGGACLTGIVASPQRELLSVPSFGIAYERNLLTPVGYLLGAIPFALLTLSAVGVWKDRRRGVEGTTPVLFGFALFILATIEEVLVSAGVVSFIFLGDLGYICVVMPVSLQLLRRFRDDADQLDVLTEHLADEVQRRTEERDRAREQIIEQQRLAALGRLAAGVGHEINNPLQYLRFTLEELRECARDMDNEHAATMIEHSFEGVDRIRQVVEDLRTYVRPSMAELVPLDLRDVVQAALRVGAPQFRQGITVTTDFGAVPSVIGHEGRLVQVVLNPLVNGMQAMQHAGQSERMTMHVRTCTNADGWAELEIRDQGPGFSSEVISRLGEPYVTTKSGAGGTGLGLFVSRGIVEAHGGRMSFDEAPDGGAIVRVALPPAKPANVQALLDRTPVSGTLLSPSVAADRPPLRVLMVEDDEQALRALVRGLEMEGVTPIGFTNGEEALTWLQEQGSGAVQLVITDLMMPGMSGWEFGASLGEQFPALRETLVVLTGGAATPEAQEFVQDEGLLVLEKPIARQVLASALRRRAGIAVAASP
jgi:signal transduction histidine kinase/ActR/RegA family two-component response regulator